MGALFATIFALVGVWCGVWRGEGNAAGVLYAKEAQLLLGGAQGWQSLTRVKNLRTRVGRAGHPALELSSAARTRSVRGDLYLSFDDPLVSDLYGRYRVQSSSVQHVGEERAHRGAGAALFRTMHRSVPSAYGGAAGGDGAEGVVLQPNPGALFYGSQALSSFSIEFWLYPAVSENGAVLFRWRSSLSDRGRSFYQHIVAHILQHRLEWRAEGLWNDVRGQAVSLRLRSRTHVLPERWSHHMLTYDETRGVLEYRMNGRTECLEYLTDSQDETGQVWHARLGAAAAVHIGERYSGLIDEVVITEEFVPPSEAGEVLRRFNRLARFDQAGGRFESEITDAGGLQAVVRRVNADVDIPEQADVAFFVRVGQTKEDWTLEYPLWQPVVAGQPLSGLEGRYFQVAVQLYPDGAGRKTPVVHAVTVDYEQDERPLPPGRLFAQAADGSVILTWTPSVDFDVEGYVVYVGDTSGMYFVAGSPIRVGKRLSYTVRGLQNGVLYFFALAAYDGAGEERIGQLSAEAWARPLPHLGTADIPSQGG